MHLIFPWDVMTIYDIRLQQITAELNALTRDGLEILVEMTVRYRPDTEYLGLLHKYVGPGYAETLLVPEVKSLVRREIALYRADEIYSSERRKIQKAVLEDIRKEIRVEYPPGGSGTAPYIIVEDILFRSMQLPALVKAAIEAKIEQKQIMEQYEYRLKREQYESKRKEVEATGIRKFQEIVAGGISERYLRWKGIDATLALARSANAKVVVIGAGEGGLPLILGNMDGGAKSISSSSQSEEGREAQSRTIEPLESLPLGGPMGSTPGR
jgi:regulator of protease activity HflC (stomatin/prohibitin superfamily)